jgi:hypothetical protein
LHLGRPLIALLAGTVFFACSSMKMPKAEYAEHEAGKDIPAIDDMIVSLKGEYIERCYAPVAKRNPPDNQCQTELFQLLERRYRLSYLQEHVDMASDELFFRDVDSRLRKMVKTDVELRDDVRHKFSSMDDMLAYYKSKYSFHTVDSIQ